MDMENENELNEVLEDDEDLEIRLSFDDEDDLDFDEESQKKYDAITNSLYEMYVGKEEVLDDEDDE